MINKNQNINLDTNEINAIRGMYAGYQYQEQAERDSQSTVDPYDLIRHSFKGETLFSELEAVSSSWGCDTINYSRLENIFAVYLSHKPDHESVKDTFSLYSKLFRLVATILESKEFIYFELVKHQRLLEIHDSKNDQGKLNEFIIFPNTAA